MIIAAGSGEVVTDRPERRIEILVARDELVVTWSRYEAGERGPDPHVHRLHSDCFYVLKGELEFTLGPDLETRVAPAGSFVAAPPGLVHTFRNASAARALYLNMHAPGGGFAAYMRGEADGFDSHDPPADGGLPLSAAILCEPGDGLSVELPGRHLAVTEMTAAGSFPAPEPHHYYVLDGLLDASDEPVRLLSLLAPAASRYDSEPA